MPKLKLSGCLFHTHRRWDDFKYENLIIFSLDIEILWNGSCVVCHFISVSLFNFVILSFWRFSLGDTPRHDVFSYQFRWKTPAHNISLPIYTQQIIKYTSYFLIDFGSEYIQYFAYGMECIQNSPCLILYYENKTFLAMKLFFFSNEIVNSYIPLLRMRKWKTSKFFFMYFWHRNAFSELLNVNKLLQKFHITQLEPSSNAFLINTDNFFFVAPGMRENFNIKFIITFLNFFTEDACLDLVQFEFWLITRRE